MLCCLHSVVALFFNMIAFLLNFKISCNYSLLKILLHLKHLVKLYLYFKSCILFCSTKHSKIKILTNQEYSYMFLDNKWFIIMSYLVL